MRLWNADLAPNMDPSVIPSVRTEHDTQQCSSHTVLFQLQIPIEDDASKLQIAFGCRLQRLDIQQILRGSSLLEQGFLALAILSAALVGPLGSQGPSARQATAAWSFAPLALAGACPK